MERPASVALRECIRMSPGIHLREAARRCHLTLGTTFSHLTEMVANGVLDVHVDGRYRRYFIRGELTSAEQQMLIACRAPRVRWVIEELLKVPRATQKQIALASQGDVSRSSIALAMRTLRDRGIVALRTDQRDRAYELVDPGQASAVLTRFADSFQPTMGVTQSWASTPQATAEESN